MIVYIVVYDSGELCDNQSSIVGVYSTEEKAQQMAAEANAKATSKASYYVEDWELDK